MSCPTVTSRTPVDGSEWSERKKDWTSGWNEMNHLNKVNLPAIPS